MAETRSQPQFERRPSRTIQRQVESYCRMCGKFIAASKSHDILKIAEKAHNCPVKAEVQAEQ